MKKTKQDNPKTASSTGSIVKLRKHIDQIDGKILELINQRLIFVKEIGNIKAQAGNRIMDSGRENELLKRLKTLNRGPLNNHSLQHIFTEIIAAAREIQTPLQVAYLGPEATFTHMAAVNHFGRSISFVPQTSIRDIFNEVEKGTFHYGVVPVENSIEGAVNYTLDLFFESNLRICAEVYYNISHDLLSRTSNLKEIRVIYSHPHAFAQCRRWLRNNLPDVLLTDCSSTSEAAIRASREKKSAAIASREAAESYKLAVVASKIEDVSRNVTRFLVIGKHESERTGKDKTSIMFATAHVPGALYRVLKPIAKAGINMVKLESRPTKHENWSYFFFVDLEGHMKDTIVLETVTKLKELCLFLKVLGSYPQVGEEQRKNVHL